MKHFMMILAVAALSGCYTGQRSEDKTGFDRLNGETYTSTPGEARASGAGSQTAGALIKIGDQRPRPTKVSGTVYIGEGISKSPLSRALVQIKKDDKVIAEQLTEGNGEYKLIQVLPNGRYMLHVESGNRKKVIEFGVRGYLVEKLDVDIDAK